MSDQEETHNSPLGFWGTIITSTSPLTYTPPEDRMLRVSGASLPHTAKASARASLLIHSANNTSTSNKPEPITITTLSNSHPSASLDLYLLGGEEVTFSCKGDSEIHVSGYTTYHHGLMDEGEFDEAEDEDEATHEYEYADGYDDAADNEVIHGGWGVRPAASAAVKGIIQELAEQAEDEDEDELDDSDYLQEMIDDEDEDEDDEEGETDEEDEEEEEEEEEELVDHDQIRKQLAHKIRVVGSDHEEEEEEVEEEQSPPSASTASTKKKAGTTAAGTKGPSTSAHATPDKKKLNGVTPTPNKAQTPTIQPTVTANGKRKAQDEKQTQTPATKKKKSETGSGSPSVAASPAPSSTTTPGKTTSSTAAAGPGAKTTSPSSSRTIHCSFPSCNKTFNTDAAMHQHQASKHQSAAAANATKTGKTATPAKTA